MGIHQFAIIAFVFGLVLSSVWRVVPPKSGINLNTTIDDFKTSLYWVPIGMLIGFVWSF